jgi:hypothetical protein
VILFLRRVSRTMLAEAFNRYASGQCLVAICGGAWRHIQVWILAPPRRFEIVPPPAVSEPFLAWSV